MQEIDMGYELNEAEMYPCDMCGEAYPLEEMYQLEDGSIVCECCLQELENQQ